MRGTLASVFLTALLLTSLAPGALADHGPLRIKSAEEAAVYHNWVTLTRDLEHLAEMHGDLVTLESIGQSVGGLDIWGVHIAATGEELLPLEARERIYIDGGTHANEQLGMELAYSLAHWLATAYEHEDEQAQWLVENRDIYIVPMLNPDSNTPAKRMNTNLVDLNRNYPFAWGGVGTSDMPGPTYRGPAPASEPEVQANIEKMTAFDPDLVLTMHTGIEMWIHPWGANDTAMPDQAAYDALCADLEAGEESGKAPCGNAEALLYGTTGATDDFAYGSLGAIAITYEVDDEQNLFVSPDAIRTRLSEAWQASTIAMENAHRYGNLPALVDATLDGDTLRLTLVNAGTVGTDTNDLHVHDAATDELLLEAGLGHLAPGQTADVVVTLPDGVDTVDVGLVYDRVNWDVDKTRHRFAQLDLTALTPDASGEGSALAMAYENTNGLLLAAPDQIDQTLTPASVDGASADTPLPTAPILGLLLLVGALLRRRT